MVLIYLSGWVIGTIAAYTAARHLHDRCEPSPHPLCVSVLAGALWPLLLVGLVELSSVVMLTKAQPKG
ncbi:hypothetical protein C8E89_1529 [Mycolicibacterium moriokaense]|uniref:Uncharacterized protein n=2 Tax=Mycolicibacterium moriokaense TaxID=39691 RepID=A0A318H0M8_9MYCO|nr:hypothetical protein C8E89_1529 [Mycolicibacterium moriokaense]